MHPSPSRKLSLVPLLTFLLVLLLCRAPLALAQVTAPLPAEDELPGQADENGAADVEDAPVAEEAAPPTMALRLIATPSEHTSLFQASSELPAGGGPLTVDGVTGQWLPVEPRLMEEYGERLPNWAIRETPGQPGRHEMLGLIGKDDITSNDVLNAQPTRDAQQYPAVMVILSRAGGKRMDRLTRDNIDQPLAVVVQGEIIMVAVIRARMDQGLVITGGMRGFSPSRARELVELLRPADPVPLDQINDRGWVASALKWVTIGLLSAGGLIVAVTYLLGRGKRKENEAFFGEDG